jgi:hypothetical protein
VAVTSLAAPGHPAPAELTAWTVARKPGGDVQVTIRELRDPAGLQRRLRADGVPATIRFTSQIPRPSQLPRDCLYYRRPPGQVARLLDRIFPPSASVGRQTAFTINPPAIPARAGLWINVRPPAGRGPDSGVFSASLRLVYASGHCPAGKAANPPVGFILGGISGS